MTTWLDEKLKDPKFRALYEEAQEEIEWVEARLAERDEAVKALREIAKWGCHHELYTEEECRNRTHDREDWCLSCVAADALERLDAEGSES